MEISGSPLLQKPLKQAVPSQQCQLSWGHQVGPSCCCLGPHPCSVPNSPYARHRCLCLVFGTKPLGRNPTACRTAASVGDGSDRRSLWDQCLERGGKPGPAGGSGNLTQGKLCPFWESLLQQSSFEPVLRAGEGATAQDPSLPITAAWRHRTRRTGLPKALIN